MSAIEARNPDIEPSRWVWLAQSYPIDAYLNPARELFALENPAYAWTALEQEHAMEWPGLLLHELMNAGTEVRHRALLFLGDFTVTQLTIPGEPREWTGIKEIMASGGYFPAEKARILHAAAKSLAPKPGAGMRLFEGRYNVIVEIIKALAESLEALNLRNDIKEEHWGTKQQEAMTADLNRALSRSQSHARKALRQMSQGLDTNRRIALCRFLLAEAVRLYPEYSAPK